MSGQQEPDETVEEDEVPSREADRRPARRGPGDPVAKGMRRAHVVQTMNAVKKKVRCLRGCWINSPLNETTPDSRGLFCFGRQIPRAHAMKSIRALYFMTIMLIVHQNAMCEQEYATCETLCICSPWAEVCTYSFLWVQLREEVGTCGNQAAFLCVFAAMTSTRGAEHVHYIIEASDDCVLTSAGCTFDETGNPKLSRHMEAGIMQALARQEDLDK